MHVTNSTLYGSGIATWNVSGGSGTVTVGNTVVTGGSCGADVIDGSGNLAWYAPGCPGTTGDPRLRPLAWNGGPTQTMATDPGSAAIGGADGSIALAPVGLPLFGAGGVDQRGVPRTSPFDIGAYER